MFNLRTLIIQSPQRVCIRCFSSGSGLGGVFKRLPNISSMKLSKKKIDLLCLQDGVQRNLPRKITFKILDQSEKINNYVMWQEARLTKLAKQGRGESFGKISGNLCLHSACFFAIGLRAAVPNGYKDIPLKHVHTIYRLYKKNTLAGKFGITRKYVDKVKPDGTKTFRPLGVPTVSSRILLALMSRFITIAVMDDISPNQHAFIPGRGTNTAGARVLSEVITYQWIWEFDLKNFFGEVLVDRVKRRMVAKYGLSGPFKALLNKALHTTVRFGPQKLDKINEQAERGKAVVLELTGPLQSPNLKGLPQGAAISPILSILMLDELFDLVKSGGAKLIMYADDGIVYSDTEFRPGILWGEGVSMIEALQIKIREGKAPHLYNYRYEDDDRPALQRLGVEINQEKSKWVRRNGEGLCKLKFLGLVYDPGLDKLAASTRNGATMLFDKMDLIKALNARDGLNRSSLSVFQRCVIRGSSGAHLLSSSLYGFVISRLYADDGSLENNREVGDLEYERSTGADSYIKSNDNLRLYNASSYAYKGLIDKIHSTNNSGSEGNRWEKGVPQKQKTFVFNTPRILLDSEMDALYNLSAEEFENQPYDDDDKRAKVETVIRRVKVGMLTKSRIALGYTTPEREFQKSLKGYNKMIALKKASSTDVAPAVPAVKQEPLNYVDHIKGLPLSDGIDLLKSVEPTINELEFLELLIDEARLETSRLTAALYSGTNKDL